MIRWWLEVLAIFLPTRGWSFGAWIKCQVAVWRACSWFSTSTAADRLKLIDGIVKDFYQSFQLELFSNKNLPLLPPLVFLHLEYIFHSRYPLFEVKPVVHTTILVWGGVHGGGECWVEVAARHIDTSASPARNNLLRSHWSHILWWITPTRWLVLCSLQQLSTWHSWDFRHSIHSGLMSLSFDLWISFKRTDSSDVIAVWSPKKTFRSVSISTDMSMICSAEGNFFKVYKAPVLAGLIQVKSVTFFEFFFANFNTWGTETYGIFFFSFRNWNQLTDFSVHCFYFPPLFNV